MFIASLLAAWVPLTVAATDGPPVVQPLVWRLLAAETRPIKVWVFFKDKGVQSVEGYSLALAQVAAAYPARAVERRRLRRTAPGLFDWRDLPVCARYLQVVSQTGAAVCVVSPWLNAVSVRASAEQVRALARLPFVEKITPVRRGVRQEIVPLNARVAVPPPAGLRGFYGLSEAQLNQIGIPALHALGYAGQGVIIGVLDTGFQRTHAAFNDPTHPLQVVAEWDFIDNDGDTSIEPNDDEDQHFHGTSILGALAAYKPYELVGAAYDAAYILVKTEDITREVPLEEDFYVAGLQFIELHGGDVATSSLGYIQWYDYFDLDGQTAVTTLGVNIATANGLLCVTAAGNRGRDNDLPSLMAPGDAFEVITCGAATAAGDVTDYSSNGPTADGRVKPEVLARGEDVVTVGAYDNTTYAFWDGTSMATPLVASAVALLVQVHPDWTVAKLRAELFHTASYYAAHGTYDPEFARGYGLINAFKAARPPRPQGGGTFVPRKP